MRNDLPRPLFTLTTAAALAAFCGSASAITVLSDLHDPIHINQAQKGDATAIGAINLISDGGFGSGTIITGGNNNVWVLTAAHVLIDVGATGTDPDLIPAELEFTHSSNRLSGNSVPILDWYIPDTYDGAVVNAADIALVRLDLSMADYTGRALPLYSRATPEDAANELIGESIQFVGFGSTGTGDVGNIRDDGFRRTGKNRVDGLRDGNFSILTTDFDVDRDDENYDLTPNDFTDRNPFIEASYALKNTGLFTQSGGVEPRQVPEEDFRVGFEAVMSPGDSGGAYLAGGAVAGVHSFGQRDDEGVSSQFTFNQGFVSVSPWVDWINFIIFQVESGGTATGNVDAGVFIGSPGAPSIAETEEIDVGEATNAFNQLLTGYYAGFELSVEDKMKLLNFLPVSNDTVLTSQQVIDRVGERAEGSYASALAVIDSQLASVWGAPTPDRATNSVNNYFSNSLGKTNVFRGDVEPPTFRFGDINNDGDVDATDIDLLLAGIAAGAEWADYSFDDTVNAADLTVLLEDVLATTLGDANLDGSVNQADLDAVLTGWGLGQRGWAGGDFGGEAGVGQYDLDAVLANWGAGSAPDFTLNPNVVPEPSTLAVLALSGLVLRRRRQA